MCAWLTAKRLACAALLLALFAAPVAAGTIYALTVYGIRFRAQASFPSNCGSGTDCIDVSSVDDHVYFKNQAGTVTQLDSGGAPTATFQASSWAQATADFVVQPNTTGAGAASQGTIFSVMTPAHSTGMQFYWNPGTSRSVKCSLWDSNSGTRLQTVTITTGSGAVVYTCTWPSSQALTAYKFYAVSIIDLAGLDAVGVTLKASVYPNQLITYPIQIGSWIYYWSINQQNNSGDAYPTSTVSRYMGVDPTIVIP